jgi:hypothetical protein
MHLTDDDIGGGDERSATQHTFTVILSLKVLICKGKNRKKEKETHPH